MLGIILLSLMGFLSEGAHGDDLADVLALLRETVECLPSLRVNVSAKCRRDFHAYVEGVKNAEKWAVAMIDSMEKGPSGILLGRRVAVGQFGECVAVVHPNFTGQHCMLEMALRSNPKNFSFSHMPNFLERLVDNQFSVGFCVPSTCDSTDLGRVFQTSELSRILRVEIKESSCNTGEFLKLRTKDYLVLAFFFFIILLATGSTAYDLHHRLMKKNEYNQILASFSLYSNLKLLFQVNKSLPETHALYGIRFLSMSWVVLGHLFAMLVYGYEINNLDKMEILNSKLAILATNAYVTVDSFFFLSGLLVCFVFFREISKKGSYDAPVALIHRYLRLTPPLAALVLFRLTIFSRMGIAPYWKAVFEEIETSCQNYWWSYVLYVQNYFFPGSQACFSQAWYLCADMHMFMLSPVILYFLLLRPRSAPVCFISVVSLSSLVTFITCYVYDIPPNRSLESISPNRVYEYIWSHTRMTPWLVGIATGYVICGIRAKKIQFRPKRVWVAAGWSIAAILCLSSLFGIAAFLPYQTYHSRFEKSTYRTFHRLGWALGLSWVVIACLNDYGGPVNTFLSLKIFQPLAKLSYCIYLIHPSVQFYRNFHDSKSLTYYDAFACIYAYMGDLTVSVLISIPMTLLFEMPFGQILKILMPKLTVSPFPKPANADKGLMKDQKEKFGCRKK